MANVDVDTEAGSESSPPFDDKIVIEEQTEFPDIYTSEEFAEVVEVFKILIEWRNEARKKDLIDW